MVGLWDASHRASSSSVPGNSVSPPSRMGTRREEVQHTRRNPSSVCKYAKRSMARVGPNMEKWAKYDHCECKIRNVTAAPSCKNFNALLSQLWFHSQATSSRHTARLFALRVGYENFLLLLPRPHASVSLIVHRVSRDGERFVASKSRQQPAGEGRPWKVGLDGWQVVSSISCSSRSIARGSRASWLLAALSSLLRLLLLHAHHSLALGGGRSAVD